MHYNISQQTGQIQTKFSVDGRTLSKDTSDCYITFNYRCLTEGQHRFYAFGK